MAHTRQSQQPLQDRLHRNPSMRISDAFTENADQLEQFKRAVESLWEKIRLNQE